MSVEDMEQDGLSPGSVPPENLELDGFSPGSVTPEKPRVKWVPRPQENICRVCSGPATDIQHYGSITCYSCR